MKWNKGQINAFRRKIFDWWKDHRRDLPWRWTNDPYTIFVSEVMLQQTQVSRVLPKYKEFLDQFPNIFSLAKASPAAVLRVWKGMGYNRRALYLQQTAKRIVLDYHGIFPQEEKKLMELPGLGKYTARAILVFAFKKNVAMIDTNIRQIITHFFFHDVFQKESIIQETADLLIPNGKSWEWHQALMDYGALAMSNIKYSISNKKNNTIPFRHSSRFYRGKIIDQLREHAFREDDLIDDFRKRYGKSKSELNHIIIQLKKEHLIEKKTHTLSLPDS